MKEEASPWYVLIGLWGAAVNVGYASTAARDFSAVSSSLPNAARLVLPSPSVEDVGDAKGVCTVAFAGPIHAA